MICPNVTPELMVEVRGENDREPKRIPVLYWLCIPDRGSISVMPMIWHDRLGLTIPQGGKVVKVEET